MPEEDEAVRPPTLVLKRPLWRVVVLGICIMLFSFGLIDGWLGTGLVKAEGGSRMLLLPIVLISVALLGLELFARKNHRLEMDQERVRVWDWKGRLQLDTELENLRELRTSDEGEYYSVRLIAKGGEARLTELGSLYDLGTALRKLGTVKVDDRL